MTRVQYYTACSLDGFIADEDDSLDWLFEAPHGDDEGGWDAFLAGVGAMAMGATTYEWVLAHEDMLAHPERWHAAYADRPCWVFTHRDLPVIPGADVRLVSGDVGPAYQEMVRARPDKNVWVVGGGDLAGQFDDAGLLDEVRMVVQPVFLGGGAPLLPRRITSRRTTLREVHHSGQDLLLVLDLAQEPRA